MTVIGPFRYYKDAKAELSSVQVAEMFCSQCGKSRLGTVHANGAFILHRKTAPADVIVEQPATAAMGTTVAVPRATDEGVRRGWCLISPSTASTAILCDACNIGPTVDLVAIRRLAHH